MQSIQLPVTQVGLEQSIQQALKTAGRNAQINLGTNSRQINALAQPLGRITGQADEFTKSMEAANARVFAFGASVGVINGVSKAFQALVKNTIATEKALTDININLKQSSSELDKFGNNLFNLAKSTGQSFETVAEGALELSRQGLDAQKVLKRLNDALILSRLSGLDAQQSVEGLTAAINSFADAGITSSQILNKLVVVSQQYAVSERDLIEGIKRSASVADQAGVSFDELVGIITTVQERTARGGAVIGNAFKTIFSKIQDKGALEDLDNLGIQVVDTAGKILPATEILQNLAKEFQGLSQTKQADISKKLGGVYQLSNLLAAVKDLGSEQSKYADIVKLSQGATSEAYKKNAALNETLSAIINKVSISAEQLGATLGKIGITDNLRDLLNFFGGLLDSIQNILGEESAMGGFVRGLVKGIGNLISGPGLALFGAIIVKLSKDLVQFGFSSLKGFFGIGKAAKDIADVEKAINTALATNIGLQQKLFSLEGNRAGQLKVITDALIQQEAVIRRSAAISKDLASPSYGLGIRATGQGLRVPEKNAAAGYMPALAKESSDISRGVGGARSGDKPVVIPNFNFGGGKKGSIVAHTGEYAIPNFAGSGGTAIFNRDMVKKMGLPAGAKKIGAAGGLIPNFAAASRDLFVDRVGLSGKTVKGEWNAFINDNPNLNINDKKNPYSSLGDETVREAYLNWRSSGEKSLQRRIKEEESIKLMQGDYSSNIALLYPSSKQKTGFATTKGGNIIKIASVVSHPDDFLYKELRQSFINTSRNYVKNIGINPDVVDDQKFLDIANKTLNEGTLQSAVGNVFETALQAASGIQSKKSNANFDILGEGSIKGFAASFGSANGLQPNSHLSNVLNRVKALDFKNALNNDNINSFDTKIKNAIQMGEIKTPKLENKASGYIPNYVSKSREIGRGVQGAFYRLGEKDGTQVGVKKFFKDGPSKAVEFEWLVSEFINKYANIPSIFGPKNLSSLEDSKRKLSIRKEVISDPLAKTALGSQVSESFGRRVLFSALGARGLSIEDLHGSNYTVNKNAENQIDQLRNYPQNAVGAFATLRSMAAAGAKIGILDPGAAKVSGIARDIIGKILIKQTQQKTAANGFIPNFAQKSFWVEDNYGSLYRRYKTEKGSTLDFEVDDFMDEKSLKIDYITSKKKGDAYKLFLQLAKLSKRTKLPILSDQLVSQKERKISRSKKPIDFNKMSNWDELIYSFPQLKYRQIPNLVTSGSFGGNDFETIEELKKFVTEMPKKEFQRTLFSGIGGLTSKYAARGFLPNFADPLKQAISREMAAGVPSSQIYIDKSPSLKNAANPMGLMVANRRDEPMGGHQGVSRAIKEGRNPKTYGAASGFVPNYAAKIPEIAGQVASSLGGGTKFGSDVEKAINEFGKKAIAAGGNMDKLSKKLEAALVALGNSTDVSKKVADESKKQAESIKQAREIAAQEAKAKREALAAKKLNNQGLSQTTDSDNKSAADFVGKVFLFQSVASALTGVFSELGESGQKLAQGLNDVSFGVLSFNEFTKMGRQMRKEPKSELQNSLENFNTARKSGASAADLADAASAISSSGGGMITSKLANAASKTGVVGKVAGGTLGAITKIGPLFGKMLPVIGQVITAFQAVNAIGKIFGKDLAGWLMDLGTGFARALNIIDTEAEAAAKSLSKITSSKIEGFGKGQFNTGESALGSFMATYMTEGEKKQLRDKYKISSDASQAEYAAKANAQQFEFATFKNNKEFLARQASISEAQLQEQYNVGGPTALQKKYTVGTTNLESGTAKLSSEDVYKGFSDLQFKALTAFETDLVDKLSSEESRQKYEKAVSAGLKGIELDPFINDLFASVNTNIAGNPELKKKIDEARKSIAESGNLNDAGKKQELAKKLLDIFQDTTKEAKIQESVNLINLQLAEQKLDNAIKYKLALLDINSQQDLLLSIEKELINTTDARKISIDRELSARKSSIELVKQQAGAAADFLRSQEAIKNAVGEAIAGKINEKSFEKIRGLVDSITEQIIQQQGYNSQIKNSLEDQLKSIFGEGEAYKKILNLLDSQLNSIADQIKLTKIQEDLTKKTTAIVEAKNSALNNERNFRLQNIDLLKEELSYEEKLLNIRDDSFKNRAEQLKSIAPKGMQDNIDVLINKKERSSVVLKAQNQQQTIFRNLQKDLLSNALEKNLGQGLVSKIEKASSINELANLGKDIAEAEKNAAIIKLDAAFSSQKLVVDSADYFYKKIIASADYLKSGSSQTDFIENQISNLKTLAEQGVPGAEDSLKQMMSIKNAPDIEEDYRKSRAQLEQSNFSQSTAQIGSAMNEASLATEEMISKLEQLNPAFLNASKDLEKQFNKLLLSFTGSMAEKQRENIALSGRIERLSMQKDFELQNPKNFAGITDPQEYLNKQQQIEKEFFDKTQQLEFEKAAKEAEIQFKTEQMTLENTKQLAANTEALQKLYDALAKEVAESPANTPMQNRDLTGVDTAHLRKLIASEVGGQSQDAQAAFLSTVFNRASMYGQSVDSVAKNAKYYEPLKNPGRFAQTNPLTEKQFKDLFNNPNINSPYTHNVQAGSQLEKNLQPEMGLSKTINGETFYTKNWEKSPDKAWAEVQKLSMMSGDLSEAAQKAAEAIGYTGDAAIEKATELTKAAEGLRNIKATQFESGKTLKTKFDIQTAQAQPGSFKEGMTNAFRELNKSVQEFESKLGQEIPAMFASGMANAINSAIEGTASLGDALKAAAYEFVKGINQKIIGNLVDKAVGGLGNLIPSFSSLFRASGGAIVGGSGNKDDVPAMLMGGEFVMNKKAVQKYGPDFLNALNSGSISGYAKGGPVQKGPQGNFYTPGQYGLGAISGSKNLLGFATQSYTTGKRDEIINSGNYASINLEAESARLTNFGRQNSPAAEALRSAKGEAFSLYLRDYEAKKEEQKKQKEQSKALRNQLLMLGISVVGGSLVKSAVTGFNNGYTQAQNLGQGYMSSIGSGINGVWSGYNGSGGLSNIFSDTAFTPRAKIVGDVNGMAFEKYRATGGPIPSTSGIDTVSTMLSGGEFIMNRAAAQNIGSGNLQALNSGAKSLPTEEKSEELNDRLISKLDELIEASGSAGNITINVEGGSGKSSETSDGNGSEGKQQLARQIRDAVLKVIQEEKRLGGQLRRGM